MDILFINSYSCAMKTIIITRKRTNAQFKTIVDDEMYDKVCSLKLYIIQGGQMPYVYIKSDNGLLALARFIVGITDKNEMAVDHINRDTLDNRASNLRIVDRSKNLVNRKLPRKHGEYIYPGVYLLSDGRYEAYLKIEKKLVLQQKFKSVDDAIDARKQAEQAYGVFWNNVGQDLQHMGLVESAGTDCSA